MSLIINESYQITNSSPFNNTLTQFSFTLVSAGLWNWTVEVCDNENKCVNATHRNITFQNDLAITLNLPNNDDDFFTLTNSFNATGSDDTSLANMTLYVNESLISTNSSVINNTLTNFEHTAGTIGFFNWTIGVCDNLGFCINATHRNFTISSNVNATLNQPINEFNTTIQTIIFNATGSDDTSLANISFILNATYNGTNSSVFNNTLTQFPRTLADGFYNWTVEVCDGIGICINATARNFTIDSTLPFVNTTQPFGTVNFAETGGNFTFNATSTDANLDTCWYDYDFTNTTYTCNSGVINVTLTAQRNVTAWANDTIGNENSSIRIFDFLVFENSQTFNVSSFETASETFILNITTNGTTPSSAELIYNGTTFSSATITNTAGDNFNITRTIGIPILNGTKSFFFNITIGETELSTTTQNQIINVTNFTLCGASPQDTPFINITFKNETTNEEIIVTVLNCKVGKNVPVFVKKPVFENVAVYIIFGSKKKSINPESSVKPEVTVIRFPFNILVIVPSTIPTALPNISTVTNGFSKPKLVGSKYNTCVAVIFDKILVNVNVLCWLIELA